MIRNINRDILFLGMKSEKATPLDKAVIEDLKDTLNAHSNECIGMAANMIGVKKRIIIINIGIGNMIMINPEIVRGLRPYETEEGCLSLDGVRPTKRFREIEVVYEDESFKKQRRRFKDLTAQIIQHEIDHCDGKII